MTVCMQEVRVAIKDIVYPPYSTLSRLFLREYFAVFQENMEVPPYATQPRTLIGMFTAK
jgi:hypothetical protein